MNMKDWIKAAGIRAIRTFAQTAVGMVGGCAWGGNGPYFMF